MSGTDPGDDPSLPLSQIERLVATCDRFEAAWRAGQRPRVEDYLGDLPDPDRPALLRELLALELVYRRLSGEVLEEEEFRRRFPGHDAVVEAFRVAAEPPPPPQPPIQGGGLSDADGPTTPADPDGVTRSYDPGACHVDPDVTLSYSVAREGGKVESLLGARP